MTEIYIFWGLLALYAAGSWAKFLLPKFTDRKIPDFMTPLGHTVLAGYGAYFLWFFHDKVGDAFVQMYTMLLNVAAQVGRM